MKIAARVSFYCCIFLLGFSGMNASSSRELFQDATKDATLFPMGKGDCAANLMQIGVKNNSQTQKINVMIIKKESTGEMTTTSSIKYSGLPPGYKQLIGCGGISGTPDSLVVSYKIAFAVYAK